MEYVHFRVEVVVTIVVGYYPIDKNAVIRFNRSSNTSLRIKTNVASKAWSVIIEVLGTERFMEEEG